MEIDEIEVINAVWGKSFNYHLKITIIFVSLPSSLQKFEIENLFRIEDQKRQILKRDNESPISDSINLLKKYNSI